MATLTLTQKSHPFKVSKPSKLGSRINQISKVLQLKTDLPIISPPITTASSLSTISSNVPQYSAIPKLTKETLRFFNNSFYCNTLVMTKIDKMSKWMDSLDYHLVGDASYSVNYLDQYSLLFDTEATRQHVENISYVYNVEDFTSNLEKAENEGEKGLILGDDCEQLYYRKIAKPHLFLNFTINDTDEEQASHEQEPFVDQIINQNIDYDPKLFEETANSPLSLEEHGINYNNTNYVIDTTELDNNIHSTPLMFHQTFFNDIYDQSFDFPTLYNTTQQFVTI